MSILGSIGAIAGGIGQGLFEKNMADNSAKKNMKRQHKYNVQMMQNAHQWEVEDLQTAGINPILSAGGSPNMPSTAGPAGAQPKVSAMQNYQEQKRIDNETKIADSTAEKNEAEAKQSKTQTQFMDETGTYPGMPTESEESSESTGKESGWNIGGGADIGGTGKGLIGKTIGKIGGNLSGGKKKQSHSAKSLKKSQPANRKK